MYLHLLARSAHADKCTERACHRTCGHRRLREWLDGPLLPGDAEADERIRQRRRELMRGEIPA